MALQSVGEEGMPERTRGGRGKDLESDEAYNFPLEKATAYTSSLMRQILATTPPYTHTQTHYDTWIVLFCSHILHNHTHRHYTLL